AATRSQHGSTPYDGGSSVADSRLTWFECVGVPQTPTGRVARVRRTAPGPAGTHDIGGLREFWVNRLVESLYRPRPAARALRPLRPGDRERPGRGRRQHVRDRGPGDR